MKYYNPKEEHHPLRQIVDIITNNEKIKIPNHKFFFWRIRLDNEKGSHQWIWIVLGLTIFTITVGAGILLYIEWTWEPPGDIYEIDIPKFKAKAVSANDTVEVTPLDRTLSWHYYGIMVHFNDDNGTRTLLVTNSSKTEISGTAFFTGIDFDPGDEFEVWLVDLENNAVVSIQEVKAI
jgi:hypothetical protein